jgi:hypothetical protein
MPDRLPLRYDERIRRHAGRKRDRRAERQRIAGARATVAPVVPKLLWPVVPVTVPQVATPLATVALAFRVTPAGNGSVTVTLLVFDGPALVTTTV